MFKRLKQFVLLSVILASGLSSPVMAVEGGFSLRSADISEKTSYATASISEVDGLKIKYNTVFHNANDFVIYRLVLRNDSNEYRKITGVTDDSTNTYVDYLYEVDMETEIAPNDTFTLKVKAFCKTTADNVSFSDNIKIRLAYVVINPSVSNESTESENETKNPVEEEEPVKEEVIELISVPDTGFFGAAMGINDNISFSMTTLTVAAFGLLVSVVLIAKRHPKIASRIAIISLSVLLFTPATVKADDTVAEIEMNGQFMIKSKIHIVLDYKNEDGNDTSSDYYMNYGNAGTIQDLVSDIATPYGFNLVKWVYDDDSDVDLDTSIVDDVHLKAVYVATEEPTPDEEDDPTPITGIMQTFSCSSLTTNQIATLTDNRNNGSYTVAKLEDGNCWMLESLSIANKEITHIDSDLDNNESFTIPSNNINAFTAEPETSAAYIDSSYGGYYNYYTATAGGAGTICPKGWTIPTIAQYNALYNAYNSFDLMMSEVWLDSTGQVYNGAHTNVADYGFFWASGVTDGDVAGGLAMLEEDPDFDDEPNVVLNITKPKTYGFQVRCIAN